MVTGKPRPEHLVLVDLPLVNAYGGKLIERRLKKLGAIRNTARMELSMVQKLVLGDTKLSAISRH